MSAKSFGRALEPRNWFDMGKQMEGWGIPGPQAAEEAAANEAARVEAARVAAEEDAEEERRKILSRKGRRSTILTGAMGLPEETAQRKTLLGS